MYHGARERPLDEFQDFALELVKPVFEFESARWGNASVTDSGFLPYAVHLHNESEESVTDWAEFVAQDTFATDASSNLGCAIVSHFPSRYPGPAHTGIREYARKHGHENALALGLGSRSGALLDWIALYRADPDHCFTAREQRISEALLPHLLQALGINRSIWLEQLQADHTPHRPAFAMADRRGMLWFAEPDFTRQIGAEFPAWREPALPKPLITKLAAVQHFVGAELTVRAMPLGKLLLLKARPISPIDRLTPRERDVALAYGRGLSSKEVASRLGISPATVHHHLRIAYDKLAIDNKASLVRLLTGVDH